jgi:hypothetical protein
MASWNYSRERETSRGATRRESAFCRQFVNTFATEPRKALELTYLVHTDVMRSEKKTDQRRSGIRAEEAKQREFEKLVERFRNASNAQEAKRLGDRLGRALFRD